MGNPVSPEKPVLQNGESNHQEQEEEKQEELPQQLQKDEGGTAEARDLQQQEQQELSLLGYRQPNWRGAKLVDRSRWCNPKFGKNGLELRFNPIVAPLAFLIVALFVTWCVLDKDAKNKFSTAKTVITSAFAWLYIISMDIWAVVIIMIYVSKYGKLKLGGDDEKPEYPEGSWFAMLFACGVGVGLFFYGVYEPVAHFSQPNRYTADRTMPDNEVAQNALNLTFYHWGFHAWVVYSLVGLILGFITFRKGLPMTMKSCFYPLIGDRIYGWMGDLIDILSIITTLFGVCTSLGLGTMQVNAGLNFIFPSIEKNTTTQVIIIWIITAIATISVVTGVGAGVRRLSEICFGVGMFLMMSTFFLEDSWYLINLYVQTIGYYLQNMVQLGFRTDAFELLNITSAQGQDRGRAFEDGEYDAPETWMNGWTLFYWGWWISWSPFVGMFIAKISRGRTIRQFINGTLTAPMIYSFLWLTIFGGSAIFHEKEASAGMSVAGHPYCCVHPYSQINWEGTTDLEKLLAGSNLHEGYHNKTTCTMKFLELWEEGAFDDKARTVEEFREFYKVPANTYKMASNDDFSTVRLSCLQTDDQWFALMYTKGKLGVFLSVVSLFGIVLYFVTSADSGSLVIDIMAANGDQNPPRAQRIFWAFSEGAAATALLWAGGNDALVALQTASIMTGLPYAMLMSFICMALWRGLAMEFGDLNPYGTDFRIGVIDPFTTVDVPLWMEFAKNLVLAPVTMARTATALGSGKIGSTALLIISYILWFAWIGLSVLELEMEGAFAISWCCYLSFTFILCAVRASVRAEWDINGNIVEDYFASMLLYPSVCIQISSAMEKEGRATLMSHPDHRPAVVAGEELEFNVLKNEQAV